MELLHEKLMQWLVYAGPIPEQYLEQLSLLIGQNLKISKIRKLWKILWKAHNASFYDQKMYNLIGLDSFTQNCMGISAMIWEL